MILKTKSKWQAARAMLNIILQDKRFYCNWCNADFNTDSVDENGKWIPCCENPQIGRHLDHIKRIIRQNKSIQESRKNDFASTDDKTLRWGVSLPPRIFQLWNMGFIKSFNCKLLDNNQDMHEFMKEFKCFAIPKTI